MLCARASWRPHETRRTVAQPRPGNFPAPVDPGRCPRPYDRRRRKLRAEVSMHAVAEAGPAQSGLALGGVRLMTQSRSGGRWQSLDGGRSANDEAVIPRQAPRHEAVPSSKSHEDTLVRMLY